MKLEADEVTYDERTRTAEARGNVVFEREDDRLEASEAQYNLGNGTGTFLSVRGTVGSPPPRTRDYLVTTNPYYFEGERVDRRSDGSYMVWNGWITNCLPGSPRWRMRAARTRIRPDKDVVLQRSVFLIKGVPLMYMPAWRLSIADEPRKSGFLMPSFGTDSRRGTSFGGAFYWAINPHADATFEAEMFTEGGWTQRIDFRSLPSAQSYADFSYFGAMGADFSGVNQDGESFRLQAGTTWGHGFRGVADITYLSSFSFRLGFAETFREATRSEVDADAFLTNNPDTFYFNSFFHRYENFFSADPETSVTLWALPGVEVGTRPRRLPWWEQLPLYWSAGAELAGVRREDPDFETPELVQRFDLYPRLTIPFKLGRYFSLTPTLGVRSTRYSSRVVDAPDEPGGKRVLNEPLRRTSEEATVDLQFPSLARTFETSKARYKHVIETRASYRYVNGIHSFEEILRFDERDTLTDTHEVAYSIVQRLFRKGSGEKQASEFISWRLTQKYYFDADFGGALQPGERNVFAALNSVTPFAFADEPRRFSPIASAISFTPPGRATAEIRFDYDTKKGRVVNTRITSGARLTSLLWAGLRHFSTRNDTVLQPRANQLGLLVRYGALYRRGFNVAGAVNWDIRRDFLQNTVTQFSYNWDCCGVGFEYRRLGLGPLRSQNEYRFTFTIANVGTFGTLRREERIF
jgi:LPS-assembly protein